MMKQVIFFLALMIFSKPTISLEKPTSPIEPLFKNYPAKLVQETLKAPLDQKDLEENKNFKTQILEGIKHKANFAGKYRVITWGCGTYCISGVMVNYENGKIHSIPSGGGDIAHRVRSNLLILNPNERNAKNLQPYEEPKYYLWKDGNFNQIK